MSFWRDQRIRGRAEPGSLRGQTDRNTVKRSFPMPAREKDHNALVTN